MTCTSIKTVTCFVADQERAKEFYVDALGFEVRVDRTMGDNRWLEVAPRGGQTTIVLQRPFPGVAPGEVRGVILVSDDLDSDLAAIRTAGGDAGEPEQMPWARQARVADPDGNMFVLAAPIESGA